MKYAQLGRTGTFVSRICLGDCQFRRCGRGRVRGPRRPRASTSHVDWSTSPSTPA